MDIYSENNVTVIKTWRDVTLAWRDVTKLVTPLQAVSVKLPWRERDVTMAWAWRYHGLSVTLPRRKRYRYRYYDRDYDRYIFSKIILLK